MPTHHPVTSVDNGMTMNELNPSKIDPCYMLHPNKIRGSRNKPELEWLVDKPSMTSVTKGNLGTKQIPALE